MKKKQKIVEVFPLAAKLCAVSCAKCAQNVCKMCAKCPCNCRMTQHIILCCPYQFKQYSIIQYSGVHVLYDAPKS